MKITSYDSKGGIIGVANYDDFVPDFIKSYDRGKSILHFFNHQKSICEENDYFQKFLDEETAKSFLTIDYGNYLNSSLSNEVSIDEVDGKTIIKIPDFENCESENQKLINFLNFYGRKSKWEIENVPIEERYLDLTCLSNTTWILSLFVYASKNSRRYERCTDSKSTAFKIALQSVINRYYCALRKMCAFKDNEDALEQTQILFPFIYRKGTSVDNVNRLNTYYYTNKFVLKLIRHLSLSVHENQRHEAYCLLQAMRGDFQSQIHTKSKGQLINMVITKKEAPDISHTFTIKEYNDGQTVITITDREIESLFVLSFENTKTNETYNIITKTFQEIYDGYITSSYKQKWDQQMAAQRRNIQVPLKLEPWSYLFFDELSKYNQISKQDSLKEQMCFHKLIYSFLYYSYPREIKIDGNILNSFFTLLKINNCHDQIGFFEKIYTMNEILKNADFKDIELMNRFKFKDWNQFKWHKLRVAAIDDMISFLEPILNSYYVNEKVISVDSLARMIKNILRKDIFLRLVLLKKPTQLLKNLGNGYCCNIALLLNVLGALYDHDVFVPKYKFTGKLLRSMPSLAFAELVRPYPTVKTSNDYKYLTQYLDYDSRWSVITFEMEQIIVDEMKKFQYY